MSWDRADKWRAAGVIVAVVALAASLLIPEVRRMIGLEKPRSTTAQRVSWGPDHGYEPGLLVMEPHKEFIPWNQWEPELLEQVIRKTDQIPAGSTLRVADLHGRANFVTEIVSPANEVIAYVWAGGDPERGFQWDGLIRVGSTKNPVVVYRVFERHVDGSYLQVSGQAISR